MSVAAAVHNVAEVSDLSNELSPPSTGESLLDLHNRLLVVRARQTRLSELLATLVKIQAEVRKELLDRRAALETAEAEAVDEKRSKAFIEDFSSGKERNARLMGKTLEQRIAVRATEKLVVDLDAALEYTRIKHRELGSQSQDVNTRLRILSMDVY